MTKREFLKMAGLLGIGFPLQASLVSCEDTSMPNPIDSNSDTVLIIGAGAAGLTAGYLLSQQGISYQILEASSTYGGRMKKTDTFADFPIPLGAEWLHVVPSVFSEIVNDDSIQVNQEMIPYSTQDTYGKWEDNELTIDTLGEYEDLKFKNSSWFDFFDEYIVPTVLPNIRFNTIVSTINYEGDEVIAGTTGGQNFTANRVIITIPVKQLQNSAVAFTPPLPSSQQKAIEKINVWDGIKVFIEFTEQFYPTFLGFGGGTTNGQLEYYDAAYGQDSGRHILGLFAVGESAAPYISRSGEELKSYILDELGEIFNIDVAAYYVNMIEQNWTNEAFIGGAYVADNASWIRVSKLGAPIDDKVYFAGEAFTNGEDWGGVHDAARSAITAIEAITG